MKSMNACQRMINQLRQWCPQQCVLCTQPTVQQPCPFCISNIEYLPLDVFHYNLMSWPKIAKAVCPFTFVQLTAACEYRYPFSFWIKQLKFNRNLIAANALARCFSYAIRDRTTEMPNYLITAPLYPARYFKRLFNQSREIALVLQRLIGIEVLEGALVRTQNGVAQSHLDREGRLNNSALSYQCRALPVNTKRVAIIDDVLTTGATMDAMVSAVQLSNPSVIIEAWPMAISLVGVD